jgi:hypothetical protein
MGKKLCFDTKSFKRPQNLIKLELTDFKNILTGSKKRLIT